MMKKSVTLSLLLTMLLLLSSSVYAISYSRTKQADTLNQLGLFTGTGQGYQLEAAFTRAQGTAMLFRLAGEEIDASKAKLKPAFKDVKSSYWAASSIAFAVKKRVCERCQQYHFCSGAHDDGQGVSDTGQSAAGLS